MESSLPPPLPTPPPPPSLPSKAAPLNAGCARALLTAALITGCADYLLWPAPPRLSYGVFAVALALGILLNRPRSAWTLRALLISLLLIATAAQSAVELSFSNFLALTVLVIALLGETSFPALREGWPRWVEGVAALLRAPLAWRWAGPAVKEMRADVRELRPGFGVAVQIALPTFVVVAVFTALLGGGNAIFAKWTSDALQTVWDILPPFDFSPGRLGLWLLVAMFAPGIFRPLPAVFSPPAWKSSLPHFAAPRSLSVARWRSISILAALNALFFVANTIDAIYLWVDGSLPPGVSYSAFVHRGVGSLIAAVLLSALLLVLLFQQAETVTASRTLQVLSLVWIAQNVALLASVLLRLKLYVDAYQLSELRVYVAAFLLLVATGFALLARRIVVKKSLEWLLLSNLLATFALFFIMQFLDVARWVADFNVAHWQRTPGRTLDVQYLVNLGPSAYPALIAAAETPARGEACEALIHARTQREQERQRLPQLNWRSWQLRADWNAKLLVAHQFPGEK